MPLALAACKSVEEKCGESRAASVAAWTTYVDGLSGEIQAAKDTILNAQRTLKSTVEPRLNDAANRIADQRYIPGSEGWSRGRAVVFDSLCAKDDECSKLKHAIPDAQNTIKDLEERLPLAVAARQALDGNASGAKAAADAAIIDPERPALKLAQAASAQTQEVCAELPAAPDEAK